MAFVAILTILQGPAPRFARAQASPGVKLFDTRASSSAPLSGDALTKRAGWTRVPEDRVAHRFRGDAVLLNGRLAVVLRRNGPGAEVYSEGAKGVKRRATLSPAAGGSTAALSSVRVLENDQSAVSVEASFKAGWRTLGLRYELRMGQVYVQTEPRRGTRGLRVEAPCRFAVLPDFFADDIVVDAAEFPVPKADLPSENAMLHMLAGGDAIVMAVWNPPKDDVRITLSGREGTRAIHASEIRYGRNGKVWVAVMEGPGTWHMREVAEGDAGKVIRLDWMSPYPAHWRVDWRRDDDLTGSWEMLTQKPDGRYVKHGWYGQQESFGNIDWMKPNRKRWTTVLGTFQYPCWIDKDGRGHLQPLGKVVRFRGPAIVYPINRVNATPLDRFTVVDVMRATLGVGPCAYILDVEGQKKTFQGKPTCASRSVLNGIYAKRLQKQKKAEVQRALDEVLAFVQHIRGRIEDYVGFGHEMLRYLAEQKRARPELAGYVAEMEKLTRAIDARVARRKQKIKPPEHAAKLVGEFRRTLIDYEGDDALERCKRITGALVQIGGSQDELVGECRWAVKILRQRAGLAMAVDPRMAGVAGEIRRRTREMLRNPTSYEAPRH